MLRKRIVYGRPNGPTAQRRHIIIFSSATLRIEFRLLEVVGHVKIYIL